MVVLTSMNGQVMAASGSSAAVGAHFPKPRSPHNGCWVSVAISPKDISTPGPCPARRWRLGWKAGSARQSSRCPIGFNVDEVTDTVVLATY
jgi:hypothetical protein